MDEFMVIAQRNYAQAQKQQKKFDRSLKGRTIKYVITFGEKVQNDTLTVRDCIPPFLAGALICKIMYLIAGSLDL